MTITDKQVEAACVSLYGAKQWDRVSESAKSIGRTELRAALEAAEAARDAVATVAAWADGAPPHPWDKEWFVAELDNGDRAVLIALPEEYTYDFKTADQTYYMSSRLKRWMQFPDSEFVWFAERPTLTRPAAPSSAEQPPRVMIDGVDMTAQIRAAGIEEPLIAAPGAPSPIRLARISAAIAEHERIGAGHELDPDDYFARILSAVDAVTSPAPSALAADHSPDAGKMVAAPGAPEADDRARFEAAMQATHLVVRVDRDEDGRYINSALNYALDGWQARARSSVAPAEVLVNLVGVETGVIGPLPVVPAPAGGLCVHVPMPAAPVSERDGDDARRYRWLRAWPNNVSGPHHGVAGLMLREEYLDAAIDRAMGGE